MDISKTIETLKLINFDENKIYEMEAPDHHYAEMFNESIKEAIFYLEAIQYDIKQSMPKLYEIHTSDNHGNHCLWVKKVEISNLKESIDIEQLLFNLPDSEVIRLKNEIIRSKDPSDLELLKYFVLKFDLSPE